MKNHFLFFIQFSYQRSFYVSKGERSRASEREREKTKDKNNMLIKQATRAYLKLVPAGDFMQECNQLTVLFLDALKLMQRPQNCGWKPTDFSTLIERIAVCIFSVN